MKNEAYGNCKLRLLFNKKKLRNEHLYAHNRTLNGLCKPNIRFLHSKRNVPILYIGMYKSSSL